MIKRTFLPYRLTEVREERGLTIASAAHEAGIAAYDWRRFDSGSQKPKPETIHRICQALGCSVDDIMPLHAIAG